MRSSKPKRLMASASRIRKGVKLDERNQAANSRERGNVRAPRRAGEIGGQNRGGARQRQKGRPAARQTDRQVSGGPGGVGSLYRRGDIWWISYQKDGQRIRQSAETTNENEARKVLAEIVAQVAQGSYVARREAPTFELLWDLLAHDYELNHRGLKALHVRHVHLAPFFGGRRAAEIDSMMVMQYRHMRFDQGAANASINRELAALKRAFNLARQQGLLNTIPHISKLAEDNTRRNWFSAAEFERVVQELPEYLKRLARAGYITGWRVNELLSMQWRQVDFAGRRMILDPGTTKNREGRMFSLEHQELRAVLEEQREWVSAIEHRVGVIVPSVFPHANGRAVRDYYGAWRAACKRAGLPGYRFHDLRRVAVRNLEAAGISRSVAMAMVGHKTEALFRRYAIVSEPDMHEAAAKLEKHRAAGFYAGTLVARLDEARAKKAK